MPVRIDNEIFTFVHKPNVERQGHEQKIWYPAHASDVPACIERAVWRVAAIYNIYSLKLFLRRLLLKICQGTENKNIAVYFREARENNIKKTSA